MTSAVYRGMSNNRQVSVSAIATSTDREPLGPLTPAEEVMVAMGRAFNPSFDVERFVRRARQLHADRVASMPNGGGISGGPTAQAERN